MPRLLKRVTLLFAVLALGLLLGGFVLIQVLTRNVLKDETEPVRAQLVKDWSDNAARLDAALAATSSWAEPSAPTPPELGCFLSWAGDSSAVQKHHARCEGAPPALDEATLSALEAAGDALLVTPEKAPTLARDFGWMEKLHGHDDWRAVAGTPYEFWDLDPANLSITEAPLLDMRQLRGLVMLRLLDGVRTERLDDAVNDVTALARALLGRPLLIDQLVGVTLLDRTRALLDAVGQPDSGVDAATVQALRTSRLAAALVWHPWVPAEQRARFLPTMSEASRCAAVAELLAVLEIGPLLAQHYAPFTTEFATWRATNPCGSDFVTRGLDARKDLPAQSWRRVLRNVELFSRAEAGDTGPAIVVALIARSADAQGALVEVMLGTAATMPFPQTKP